MKNIFIFLVMVFPLLVEAQQGNPKLTIIPVEGATPWTSLNLNNDASKFQFAIVTDRTGGHRPGVFMDAVNKLNLLQPEFVMSVGDLIEGYTTDVEELNRQWEEFDGFISRLQMPFFYLPGNHDITNQTMEDLWHERFGATYYHFIYKNVLFLCLNSEDQKKGAGRGTISSEQFEYIEKTLAENTDVDWTLLFMHQPLWNQEDTTHWEDVEKLLAGRKHTVFTGHEHRYVKYERNNGNYFVLATTGGVSGLRGATMGEFDHVVWVTMTKDGPVIANLLLEGIWDENVFTEETKNFLDTVFSRTPIQIKPYFIEDNIFEEGNVEIKITNDENIPMKVKLEEHFSDDLIGVLDSREFEVAPNSVKIVNLKMKKQNDGFEKPLAVKAFVSYAQGEGQTEIEIPFLFNIKPLPYLKLKKTKRKKKIDGKQKDWKEFPYRYSAEEGDMKAEFNLCYDDEFLYFAANVTDDTIVSYGKGAAWIQDNIGFGFNALPMSHSAMSTGENWYENEFYQLITPKTDTTESILYRPLIEGAEIVCVTTETGYFGEFKIPISYITERQGENWKTIRVEVVVDDKDSGKKHRYWWMPNWMKKEKNIVGSGIFFRVK